MAYAGAATPKFRYLLEELIALSLDYVVSSNLSEIFIIRPFKYPT